jgi:hypothetical protein
MEKYLTEIRRRFSFSPTPIVICEIFSTFFMQQWGYHGPRNATSFFIDLLVLCHRTGQVTATHVNGTWNPALQVNKRNTDEAWFRTTN